jgi:hypothetical protein
MQLVQLLSGTESTITHSSLVDSLCHHLQTERSWRSSTLISALTLPFFVVFFLLPPISPSLSSCRRACSWHNGKFWLIDWFLGRTSNSLIGSTSSPRVLRIVFPPFNFWHFHFD